MDENAYEWTSLSAGNFRVLELLHLEPKLTITLREVAFDTATEYYAFSYAWGTHKQTEPIDCDLKVLLVTNHLKEGLKHVSKASGQTVFWVDAICINQRDNDEKADQVANIHRIFGNANAVYAWLGSAAHNTNRVFAAFDRLKDRPPDLPNKPTLHDIANVELAPRSHEKYKLFEEDLFRPVAEIARRDWFERLWIAQEFICARRVLFLCGMASIDGDSFLRALRKFNILSFGGSRPELSDTEEELRGFRLLRGIGRIRDARDQCQHTSYFDIVMSNRERKTYEPVDRIYGSIGLAIGPDEVYRDSLKIDYSVESKSCYWNLYARFGKVALLREPCLRILEFTSSSERPELLPSWCPNLNSPCSMNQFQESVYYAGGPCEVIATNDENACSRAHPKFKGVANCHAQVSDLSNCISILGARLDTVRKVGSVCDWTDYNQDDLIASQEFAKDALMWFKEGEEFCASVIVPHTLAKTVFYYVLNASNISMDRCKAEHAKELKDSDAVVYEWAKTVLVEILQLKPDAANRSDVPGLYDQFDTMSHWLNNIASVYEGRSIFLTTGGMIGIASKDTHEGDLVCMFYSGRPLYVLRYSEKNPNAFKFISDAYVFDFMKGKAFEQLHEEMAHEEEFLIE